jgi:soluble lytic murein transglycosylase
MGSSNQLTLFSSRDIRLVMRKFVLPLIIACLLISGCSAPGSTAQSQEQTTSAQNPMEIQDQPILEPQPETTLSSGPLFSAEYALFVGDFDQAIIEFHNVLNQNISPEINSRSLMGIGRTYYATRQYTTAIDTFNRLLGQYSNSPYVPSAYFYLGQSYAARGDYAYAVDAYSNYLKLKPGVIDAFVYELQGDVLINAGDYSSAISSYQGALQAIPAGDLETLNLKIGKAYFALEDFTTAIQIFQNLYDTSENTYTKASADLLMGQSYIALGMDEEANSRLLDAVIQFPRAFDAYTSLETLITRGVPVNGLLSGIVYYYAGEYLDAINQFERYLKEVSENDGSVYYYKGLSLYFADLPTPAINAYDQLIQNYPQNPFWASAWDEKAYVQWKVLGDYTTAANTLLTYVSQAPESSEAPKFLYLAARIFEEKGDLELAAQTWLRMMDEYPGNELRIRGLFLAGIQYYRLGRYADALKIFQRLAVLAADNEERAAAYVWIGKSYQANNELDDAISSWSEAERFDPMSYYSIRAGELINGFSPLMLNESYDLGYDLNLERVEAENWMYTSFNIPREENLNALGNLNTDFRMIRGQEFWQLGLPNQAITEFEAIRRDHATDPANTYRLMNYFYSIGLYQSAIRACNSLLNLSGRDDLSKLALPIYFTHIRFGTYYRAQVVQATNQYGVPPLLLFSLLLQESEFNPYSVSSANARGLAQVVPATGKEIADQLGWPPNYSIDDLNRPIVATNFAAYYLNRWYQYMDENWWQALAAYNGGIGNVITWRELSQNDDDLFMEIIRPHPNSEVVGQNETRDYLMYIVEFLNIYKLVFTHPG